MTTFKCISACVLVPIFVAAFSCCVCAQQSPAIPNQKKILNQEATVIYRHFRLDYGLGSSTKTNQSNSGGVAFCLEPSYNLLNKIKLGAKLEINSYSSLFWTHDLSSVLFTTNHYFYEKDNLRFFAGGGLGSYFLSVSSSLNLDNVFRYGTPTSPPPPHQYEVNFKNHSSFGGMIRAGMELKRFNFGISYDFVPTADVIEKDYLGNILHSYTYQNSYFSMKLGYHIGGGKKNKS